MVNKNRIEIRNRIESAFNDDKFVILTGQSGSGKTRLAEEILGASALTDKRWEVTTNDFNDRIARNTHLVIDEAQKLNKDETNWTSFIIDVLRHKMKFIVISMSIKDLPSQIRKDIDGRHIEINTSIY
ncbi:GTP-binding protein [uncultured Pseudoalteromonas sp.]|uniref:GTP-binding protein n=1 Tax=uncultured Pseudoalteromonas sp. TaxID=114053 RepID=UPI0025994921|nr:GTP-binding protein [uncultured Pseudoalteromonas sp.]